jgi:hypothetical protein
MPPLICSRGCNAHAALVRKNYTEDFLTVPARFKKRARYPESNDKLKF